MSIADEISRLKSAKSELKSAIEEKGVEVPDKTKLDGYPSLIQSIQENVQPDWEQNNPVEKDYIKNRRVTRGQKLKLPERKTAFQ